MKVVGHIISNIKDGDEIDCSYTNGVIVHLTEAEANVLSALQKAWRNETFHFRGRDLADMKMDGVFEAIQVFIEAKFSINDLKNMVKRLEEIAGVE